MPKLFACARLAEQQVAALYQQHFVLKDKLNAKLMATALNVYATSTQLGGNAAAYGFTVAQDGIADVTWNVGADGAALGIAKNLSLTVLQIPPGRRKPKHSCQS